MDGYIKETKDIFEFYGCKFHPGCCSSVENAAEKLSKDIEKENRLMSHGHLTVMRECEWDKLLPSLIETQTRFPRILHKTDTVETLIKGIETGELYGFILC